MEAPTLATVRPKWFTGDDSKDGLRDLLSGMISGFICKFFDYPLDTIKVLQQTRPDVTGPIDCVRKVHAERGLASLYQGLAAPLVGCMVELSLIFASFGYIKKALGAQDESRSTQVPVWKVWLSGAFAGIMSAFVLTPVELIKCRLQVQQSGIQQYRGPIDCVIKSAKEEGVTGLWKGNVSCLARELPGNAAWFGVYHSIMMAVQRRFAIEERGAVPTKWSAVAGAASGVAYWSIPYPADTVKSRVQTDARYKGQGFVVVLRSILREEGLRGLYRGCAITCAFAAPRHALMFSCYALVSNRLAKY